MIDVCGLDFSEHAAREILRMFCDGNVGSGAYRDVLSLTHPAGHVLKLERSAGCFHNVMEWEIWQSLKDTKHARWLAPCLEISACGTAMIQVRTHPVHAGFKLPDKVPAWLTDLKRSNWGLIEDKDDPSGYRFVCHDYGCNLLLDRGASASMKKADWSLC